MRTRLGLAALLLSSAFACKSPPAGKGAGPGDAGAATHDAGAVAPKAATALDAGAPAKLEPNLLDLVPSKVAVSSAVQNPHDFPEHLVDGRIETAWNGKTGDLAGWVAFRVPKDAKVRRIEMNVGYDRVKGAVDLFTANHRITKVAVSRDGAKLFDHAFDPNVRGLQSIPVDGPGGDYEIKVLATQPGTKPEWRELVVSELRVVGDPGKARRTASEPVRVVVGGLDKEPAKLPIEEIVPAGILGPAPGIEQLCAAFRAKVDASKAELAETARFHELTLKEPSCALSTSGVSFAPDAVYKRVKVLRVSDGIASRNQLAAELEKGFYLLPVMWAWDDPLDPGCPSIVRVDSLKSVRIENGHLLAVSKGTRTGFKEASGEGEGKPYPIEVLGATWCKPSATGTLNCKAYDPQYHGGLGAFAIAPDGTLRQQ